MSKRLEEYQKRDEEELATLIELLPENLREDISDPSLPLPTRLKLARKLSETKPQAPGYRPPGEPVPESLKAQYDAAVKAGDVMAGIALKRQMGESS